MPLKLACPAAGTCVPAYTPIMLQLTCWYQAITRPEASVPKPCKCKSDACCQAAVISLSVSAQVPFLQAATRVCRSDLQPHTLVQQGLTGGKISKLVQHDWRAFISLENQVLPSLPFPQYSGQIPNGSLQAAM